MVADECFFWGTGQLEWSHQRRRHRALRGITLGQPVWKLLGGARPQIQAFISFGVSGPNTSASQYPVYSDEELVEEAKYLVDQGHTRLKTVVGRDLDPKPEGKVPFLLLINPHRI